MDFKILNRLNVAFISFLFIIFGLVFSNQKNVYALEDLSFIEGSQDIQKEDVTNLFSYVRRGTLNLRALSAIKANLEGKKPFLKKNIYSKNSL